MTQQVLDFIAHFKGAEDVFLHGCCWWFAWILQERFHEHGWLVDIMHDPVVGHFIARFIPLQLSCDEEHESAVYFFDIRGDVTHLYDEENLENMWLMSMNEERRYGRLMCDCREFVDYNQYPAWLKE